jgi:hypothetical protein
LSGAAKAAPFQSPIYSTNSGVAVGGRSGSLFAGIATGVFFGAGLALFGRALESGF